MFTPLKQEEKQIKMKQEVNQKTKNK